MFRRRFLPRGLGIPMPLGRGSTCIRHSSRLEVVCGRSSRVVCAPRADRISTMQPSSVRRRSLLTWTRLLLTRRQHPTKLNFSFCYHPFPPSTMLRRGRAMMKQKLILSFVEPPRRQHCVWGGGGWSEVKLCGMWIASGACRHAPSIRSKHAFPDCFEKREFISSMLWKYFA